MNLYRYLLGHTLGWSEPGLRLPSVVAGLAALALLPLAIRRILKDRVALIFAVFLALSPVAIFCSRFSRAYGIVLPLCFWAILSLSQWLKSGERRHAVRFPILAGLSTYFHLSSVAAVFAPLEIALLPGLVKPFAGSRGSFPTLGKPGLKERLLLFAALLVIVFLLCLPAILNRSQLPLQRDTLTLSGLEAAAALVSGTSNVALILLFFALFCVGLVSLLRNGHNLGWITLSVMAAYFLALLILRPEGIDVGLVLLRYMIVLIPIALLMVAVALERLGSILEDAIRPKAIGVTALLFPAVVMAALLFLTDPLPCTYSAPNNFTNHTAFQGSYQRQDWETSNAHAVFTDYRVHKSRISRFYPWLKDQKDVQAIVEYPFDVCNYNNLHYFYQHFHEKRVMAGYNMNADQLGWTYEPSEKPFPQSPMIVSELPVGRILCRAEDPGLLAFRNLIDINDTEALAKSGAEVFVLRKSLMVLCVGDGSQASIRLYYRGTNAQKARLKEIFGDPIYEDEEIVCFRLRPDS